MFLGWAAIITKMYLRQAALDTKRYPRQVSKAGPVFLGQVDLGVAGVSEVQK